MSERPYEAVTVRGVSAEIGKTTGALFQFFATKEDLWREAMGGSPPDVALCQEMALRVFAHPGVTFTLTLGRRGHAVQATAPGRGQARASSSTARETLCPCERLCPTPRRHHRPGRREAFPVKEGRLC